MQIVTAPLAYWRSGGLLLIPLATVCFGIWFYYLRSRIWVLMETSRADDILGCMESANVPHDQVLNMDEIATSQETMLARLCRDAGVLRALTLVAPLMGLLGTVVGMIATFQAVAGAEGDTARQVAQGVSRALITTQTGLVIAIPGVFGQMNLRRLISRLQVRLTAIRLQGKSSVLEAQR